MQLIHQKLAPVHPADCAGVTNLKIITTNHGRQLRGSSSIDDSIPIGVSAQTAVITLSGWSGAWRWWAVYSLAEGRAGGESAAILFLAALPPRIRPSFEIFGGFPKSSKSCPQRSTTPSLTWSPTTLVHHQRHAQRKLRPTYFSTK
ncbi:hypothetical protein [Lapidilactobacillus salsurivasis]